MAEYARPGRITDTIRTCIETLSSLPSIVLGLFGFLVFVVLSKTTWNMLAGILTLSIICIPLLTRVTEDAIREIPNSYREGSYGLGATKWHTITKILIPSGERPYSNRHHSCRRQMLQRGRRAYLYLRSYL